MKRKIETIILKLFGLRIFNNEFGINIIAQQTSFLFVDLRSYQSFNNQMWF